MNQDHSPLKTQLTTQLKTQRNTQLKFQLKHAVLALTALVTLGACGKPGAYGPVSAKNDGAIIGGQDATGEEDFAQTIAGLYNLTEGSLCTASILSDSILLTAAHCVEGPSTSLRVIFGTDMTSNLKIVRRVEAYEVSPIWAFRQNEELNSGDVALVRFSGGLPAGYKPATLLKDGTALRDGVIVMLAGYGLSNGVEKTGSGRLRYVEVAIEKTNYSESEVLLDQRHGKGACHGDSGGPAYVKVNGQWILWGITNRGVNDPNNDCSVNAAYANVVFWEDWIKQTTTSLSQPRGSAPIELARAL